MAVELTAITQAKTEGIVQKPQIILEIDGVSTRYGVGIIKKYVRIGDPGLEIGNDWVIGGFNAVDDQLDVISLDGTTTTISQQLLQEKGGTGSVSAIQISLVDVDEAITQLITPGEVVPDLLGRKANVYLGYQDTAFPQDFVQIFAGVIDEIQSGATIILNIAHPEQKKRGQIFQKVSTTLTAAANFRSGTIQSIRYQTRRGVTGTVTVAYTAGGSAGSEVVSVAGNAISVQIESGVSTASQIRTKLEASGAATALVAIDVVEGQSGFAQSATGPVSLLSDTTLTVATTNGFLSPADGGNFRTYVRINDEIIEYTGISGNTLTGCTREAFVLTNNKAYGRQHQIGDTVDSFYRVQGDAITLALKVLMSGGPAYFAENIDISDMVDVEEVGLVANAVYFSGVNIADKYGLVPGDFMSISGDLYPGNNVTDAVIAGVFATQFGSYAVLSGVTLTQSNNSTGVASFKSKYNVFPAGAGCEFGGDQVDVPEFERIKELFSSSIFSYDYYLKDTITGTEFVDTKLLFPTGAFSLPRRGKISLGYSAPPLAVSNLKKFDSSNTTNPKKNKMVRSATKYLYNNIVFRYNEDVLEDKFLGGELRRDEDSKNRIPMGNKTLIIDANGLRPGPDTDVIIQILQTRFLDRYKFGAEKITASGFYGKTFNSDVGDVVIFGDSNLRLPDTRNATRDFEPRLFEVINKSLDIKTGEAQLQLLDTAYSLAGARFGIFSPSSLLDVGSTTTALKIKDSFATTAPQIEKQKWEPYIGEKILIHNDDWSFSEETTLVAFDVADNYKMLIDPPLSVAPSADYIVDVINYPSGADPVDSQLYKNIFCFVDPTIDITAGTSNTVFDVASVGDLFVGAYVLVHNEDWTLVSPETQIIDITGLTITVQDDLGFTPASGYQMELNGFPDEGFPYRYL